MGVIKGLLMRFLRIILIGSLALSIVPSAHGISLQPLINWWQSRSVIQKIAWGYLLICAATFCYAIKKDRNYVYYSKNRNTVSNILRAPIDVANAQAQQEREIKQLRDLIATGYRFTTDRYFDEASSSFRDLKASAISFLAQAIDKKPYLIPTLKELGATPMLIKVDEDVDPLLYCFEKAAKKDSPDAFNALLEAYPLSEAQWNYFVKQVTAKDNRWLVSMMLANIIPHIPAKFVNNTYRFYSADNCTLLWFCTQNSLNGHESHMHYTPLIKQLLDKGADPLKPDNFTDKTTLDLLSPHIDDSAKEKSIKKQLRDIIKPYVEQKKKKQAEVIDDAIGYVLPKAVRNICSDYEYDTDSQRLLEIVNSDQSEKKICAELSSIMKPGIPVSTYAYILNKKDAAGATPLMYAAARGHAKVAQELMDHGADIEACDQNGENAIAHAAYKGHPDVIKIILEQARKDKKLIPPLINKQDFYGNTPLITAVRFNKASSKSKEETTRLLLDYGADATRVTSTGADVLCYTGNIEDEDVRKRVVAMLEHPPRPAVQPTQSLSLALE